MIMPRYNIHQVEIIQRGLDHPECFNFGQDGRPYAGGLSGQVYVMTPPQFGLRQLGNTQGVNGGVAVDGNHNVYVCNPTRHSVLRVTQHGTVSLYCDRVQNGPTVWPNYGLFDARRNYYFCDSGFDYWKPSGRLIRVKPDGKSESLIGGNWHFANGLALSPKDGSIFMIEPGSSESSSILGRPHEASRWQHTCARLNPQNHAEESLGGLTFC